MATENQIAVEIVLDDGSIKKGFVKLEEGAKKTASTVDRSFSKSFSRLNQSLGKSLGGILKRVFSLKNVLIGLGTALIGALGGRAAIQAAAKQEDAVNALNTALKTAGTFSQEASVQFQEFAAALQQTSRFGDEVILQQTAIARTFTRTNEEAQRLVTAAVDLSAATGKDLNSSINQIGKTFSGLQGEIGESVVAIKTLTTEQLKAGEAIDLISKRFGGSAVLALRTFSGATDQAGNSFGDFLESIGESVTQNKAVIGVINEISRVFFELGQDVKENRVEIQNLVTAFVLGFVNKVRTFVIPAIFALMKTFNDLKITFLEIRIGLGEFLISTIQAFLKVEKFLQKFKVTTSLVNNAKNAIDNLSEGNVNLTLSIEDLIEANQRNAETFDLVNNKALEFENNVRKAAMATGDLAEEGGNNLATFAEKVKDKSAEINQAIRQGIVNAIVGGVSAFTRALAQGGNAFGAFSKQVLGIIGGLLIQIGSALISIGLGIDALKVALATLTGGLALAAGFALVALGGVLQGLGGGGIAAGGGVAGGAATGFEPGGPTDFGGQEEREPRTEVAVNVQGSVLTTDNKNELGTAIAEAINESFDSLGTLQTRTA